jgi:uncharacterized protein YcbK (DUF882 family)
MRLTNNFQLSEFNSKCGREMPDNVKVNVQRLANNLQALRDHLGASISINSGYRSPEHNKAVGGAANSTHVSGLGADIRVAGYTPQQVAQAIEKLITEGKMEQGGLKAYSSWVHYDCFFDGKNIRRW